MEYPHFVKAEVEFYNDTLKKAKDGEITYTDISDAPEKHIRKVFLKVFLFCSEEDLPKDPLLRDLALSKREVYQNAGIEDQGMAVLIYDPKVLEDVSVGQLEEDMYPMSTLDDYKVSVARSIYEDEYTTEYGNGIFYGEEYIEYLVGCRKEKYNKEYVFLWQSKNGSPLIADKENANLISDSTLRRDKFLTLKAQKAIGNKINQIIEEEGGAEFIVQYTAPRSFDTYELNSFSFDMTSDISDEEFLKKIYPGVYDVSLIYLKDETIGIDSIDYEMLYRITSRIKKYKEDKSDVNMGVYFYNLPNEDRPLVLDLFKRDMQTSNYFEEDGGISEIYATMYKTREETDGFHYLDVYGVKESYILHLSWDPEEFSREYQELSNTEVMKRFISSNMFGGDYIE